MKIGKKEILHTASLAHIRIKESEMEKYAKEFNSILAYIEKLNKLETSKVEGTSHMTEKGTPLRKDEIGASLEKSKAVGNRPDKKQENFSVPRFIE